MIEDRSVDLRKNLRVGEAYLQEVAYRYGYYE